jgi:hypothetical protein
LTVAVLLTDTRLEELWMVQYLLLRVCTSAPDPLVARIVDSEFSIVTVANAHNALMRAKEWHVAVLQRRPPWPVKVVGKLAVISPLAYAVAQQPLTALCPEDVQHLLITPKVCWQRHDGKQTMNTGNTLKCEC